MPAVERMWDMPGEERADVGDQTVREQRKPDNRDNRVTMVHAGGRRGSRGSREGIEENRGSRRRLKGVEGRQRASTESEGRGGCNRARRREGEKAREKVLRTLSAT
jgi:hypothetical protein